jgi:GGDEF domain-containing protein
MFPVNMISIRNEVEELERIEKARRRATECYASAIRNSADYAIDFAEECTEPHRKHLRLLAASVEEADPDVVQESRATFRNLLRDYRDRASRYLNTMRAELSGATQALEETMESLSRADGEHETKVRASIGRLREASRISEASALRAVALEAADSIASSVEEMRQQHDLTITQFQVEIRVLHQRIDTLERAASVDAMTELLRRGAMEQRIAAGLAQKCILMIRTDGLRMAASRFDADVSTQLTAAFAKRLRNGIPPGSEIGYWTEEGFIAIVSSTKADAAKAGKWIAEQLSGGYACLLDGKTVRPTLQVSVGIVDAGAETSGQIAARIREFLGA